MSLGERIEERRKAIGIVSQAALARKAGLPQSTLNGLINRPYRWSPHLARIAAALETTVAYLAGETDDPDKDAPTPLPVAPVQYILMQVALPNENALARMFEGLLATIDPKEPRSQQALLLARRLPSALSLLRDLAPEASPRPARSPASAESGLDHATRHREPT